ncbi:hypothetical protein CYY_003537 [Polysphondylium violaceum]|uniref:Uncharacterized protein n=1 Tax=Polysphondylium violaceum TaxID=133409 RepID=A0A8J4PZ20_9MYCE|nr:hypothetical protein CYY_003537 [Polysphondylium violaceum]
MGPIKILILFLIGTITLSFGQNGNNNNNSSSLPAQNTCPVAEEIYTTHGGYCNPFVRPGGIRVNNRADLQYKITPLPDIELITPDYTQYSLAVGKQYAITWNFTSSQCFGFKMISVGGPKYSVQEPRCPFSNDSGVITYSGPAANHTINGEKVYLPFYFTQSKLYRIESTDDSGITCKQDIVINSDARKLPILKTPTQNTDCSEMYRSFYLENSDTYAWVELYSVSNGQQTRINSTDNNTHPYTWSDINTDSEYLLKAESKQCGVQTIPLAFPKHVSPSIRTANCATLIEPPLSLGIVAYHYYIQDHTSNVIKSAENRGNAWLLTRLPPGNYTLIAIPLTPFIGMGSQCHHRIPFTALSCNEIGYHKNRILIGIFITLAIVVTMFIIIVFLKIYKREKQLAANQLSSSSSSSSQTINFHSLSTSSITIGGPTTSPDTDHV